jgi:hypothetical protein
MEESHLNTGKSHFPTTRLLLGKTGVLDHPLPFFFHHPILFTFNNARWADYYCEDWSKRAFFPIHRTLPSLICGGAEVE